MAAFSSIKSMKIDRMKEGHLYEIKKGTVVETTSTGEFGGAPNLPVLKGWRHWMDKTKPNKRPPFIYLGWKMEEWKYQYQNTNKIHYVLWKEEVYVMDNQFAKHIVPVWDGENDGED